MSWRLCVRRFLLCSRCLACGCPHPAALGSSHPRFLRYFGSSAFLAVRAVWPSVTSLELVPSFPGTLHLSPAPQAFCWALFRGQKLSFLLPLPDFHPPCLAGRCPVRWEAALA